MDRKHPIESVKLLSVVRVWRERLPLKPGIVFLLGFATLGVVALASVVLVVGASVLFGIPQAQSELYGTYVADYDRASEKLILKGDGTFEQEVMVKRTSEVSTTVGSWTYDVTRGNVTFHGLKSIVDIVNPDYPVTKGPVTLPAEVLWGRTQLGGEQNPYRRISSDTRGR